MYHIDNPSFGAVIFRRTFPEIRNKGGLLDESFALYPSIGATLKESFLEWSFPSGSTVKFSHLQHEKDVFSFQGSQIPLICFDELTHFTDKQFWYLLSRNRSVCGVKPYIRATCNPNADSWVADLINWWIGEDGFPIPERSGKVRWFVRIGGELIWSSSYDELRDLYPDIEPKSLTFIPAKISDNRILLEKDPGYLANLQALHPIDRARLLDGNWKIRNDSGAFINRSFFEIVEDFPDTGTIVRAWDMAGTEKHLKNDPDYTCGVKMLKSGNAYYVLDVIQVQISAAQVNDLILRTALNDGVGCKVRFEIEPGSAGKINASTLTKMLVGYDAAGIRSQGDKLTRAKGFATAAANGQVKLVRAAWCDRYLSELHNIPDSPHDDQLDSSALAFNELSKAPNKNASGAISYTTW
ncbi:phage terminase large subunit [Chroococcidiopsis sp.]|uniref:phage terminase large subunit n=1 Tax=Chroococcidiopsis sp. TaxID=3088168 RepID=UPI003F364CDF